MSTVTRFGRVLVPAVMGLVSVVAALLVRVPRGARTGRIVVVTPLGTAASLRGMVIG